MIRATEIGTLFADREELVFFSLDEVAQIAERLKIPVNELVEELIHAGVKGELVVDPFEAALLLVDLRSRTLDC